jgi:hypothetical protein
MRRYQVPEVVIQPRRAKVPRTRVDPLGELAAKEFNDEDPPRVETRKVLRAIRTHLMALREKVQLYSGDFALPRPTLEDLALMRELMARSANRSRPVSR